MAEYVYVQRKSIFRLNQHQRPVIFLILIPALLICIAFTAGIIYYKREMTNLLLYATIPPSARFINESGEIIIIVTWILFLLVLLWADLVSLSLVGAFERVIRELDAIIDGKERKPIRARARDHLANDLLKRINVLIKNLPGPGQSNLKETKGRF